MRTLGIFSGIFLAAIAVPAASADLPPDPETIVCPPSTGDLDYAFDRIMTSANFDEHPYGGLNSWRRRVDGPFHLLSAEPAQWMSVEFKRFPTSEGTRIIADLRWQTTRYEFGVDDPSYYEGIQDMLNGLSEVFPCRALSEPH